MEKILLLWKIFQKKKVTTQRNLKNVVIPARLPKHVVCAASRHVFSGNPQKRFKYIFSGYQKNALNIHFFVYDT